MQNIPSSKPVVFHGTALDEIKRFPDEAKREIGYQVHRVQSGLNPTNYKIMKTVGPGAKEIRVQIDDGIFRTIYVAKFDDAIHILHAFQKKTEKTAQRDIDLAKKKYTELVRERRK